MSPSRPAAPIATSGAAFWVVRMKARIGTLRYSHTIVSRIGVPSGKPATSMTAPTSRISSRNGA